jgi:mRNA interferase MazF
MIRGEVYWVSFDPSLGGEAMKTRPAVIVTSDRAGRHLNRLQVVPLTSNTARVFPGEALVSVRGEPRKAIASQMTTAARERFRERLDILSPADMARVESAIRILLQLP